MIVQLIGIKCVQICEAVWAESRTQSTTPIRDGRTDGHESYVPRLGHSPHGGTINRRLDKRHQTY